MKDDPWVCEICAEEFKNEIDLLAHQFNSSCERELEERYKYYDSRAANQALHVDKKLRCLACGMKIGETHEPWCSIEE